MQLDLLTYRPPALAGPPAKAQEASARCKVRCCPLPAPAAAGFCCDHDRPDVRAMHRPHSYIYQGRRIALESMPWGDASAGTDAAPAAPPLRPQGVNIHRDRMNLDDADVIYIGRPGRGQAEHLGNPIVPGEICLECGRIHERNRALLVCYERWFLRRVSQETDFRQKVHACLGKRLACVCAPGPCHGDVLADYVEAFAAAGAKPGTWLAKRYVTASPLAPCLGCGVFFADSFTSVHCVRCRPVARAAAGALFDFAAALPAAARDEWHERAAIMEIEGGLARGDAEAAAFWVMWRKQPNPAAESRLWDDLKSLERGWWVCGAHGARAFVAAGAKTPATKERC